MPFLGGFLSFVLGGRQFPIIGHVLVLNQFTAPAFVMASAAAVLLALLHFVFRDSIPKPKNKGKPSEQTAALAAADASAAKCLMGTPSVVSLGYDLGNALSRSDRRVFSIATRFDSLRGSDVGPLVDFYRPPRRGADAFHPAITRVHLALLSCRNG